MSRRQLLVLIDGVGPEDLTPQTAPALSAALARRPALPLLRETALPPGRELTRTGLAPGLRDLGLRVEQRSLVLRPRWRGDTVAIDQCAKRPGGSADVTLLELREPLWTVERHGRGSSAYLDALEQVDAHVTRAQHLLRHGDPPTLWVLCVGPVQPVDRTLDLEARLRQHLPRPLRRDVRVQVDPGGAVLRCGSLSLRHRVKELLTEPPFSHCGTLRSNDGWRGGADALWFGAADRVAFGRQPLRARLPWWPTGRAAGAAFLPAPPKTTSAVTLSDVAARLLMSAARLAVEVEAPAPRPSVADAPDLLALLRGEGLAAGAE